MKRTNDLCRAGACWRFLRRPRRKATDRAALPPHEILTILRSTGLDPLGQPVRRGPNYVLRAIDERDREVSVVVSARSGDVLSVTPVQTASRMPPPRGGVTHGAPTSGCRRATSPPGWLSRRIAG